MVLLRSSIRNDGRTSQEPFLRSPTIDSKLKGEEEVCFAIRSANDGMAAQDLFLRSPTIDSKLKGEEEQLTFLTIMLYNTSFRELLPNPIVGRR